MRAAALCLALIAGSASAQTVRLTIPLDGSVPSAVSRLDRRAAAELGAVVLTGLGQVAASEAGVSGPYIPVVIAGWGGYIGYRAATEPGYLSELGLPGRDLGRAVRDVGWVSLGATAGMAAYGALNGSLSAEPELGLLLLLYPAWGVAQQLLVQGYVTRHLSEAGLPAAAVVPFSAASFGAVHVPNWPLAGATTAMGGAFAPLYLRDRAVLPLGVAHGALGALFYTWVLDCDALAQLRGTPCGESGR